MARQIGDYNSAHPLRSEYPSLRRIGAIIDERIGDAIVWVNFLERLSVFYAPCEVVAFCTAANASFFRAYVYVDRVVEFSFVDGCVSIDPQERFFAVFNLRNDPASSIPDTIAMFPG